MTEKFIPRVFSGIQPSGGLTLGNYLGAMKRFVDMQENGGFETVYCMVDLHAITVWQDPADLRRNTRELCAGFIAAGIDPEKRPQDIDIEAFCKLALLAEAAVKQTA